MKSYPKLARWESRPYRMFVASQECFGCGIVGYLGRMNHHLWRSHD